MNYFFLFFLELIILFLLSKKVTGAIFQLFYTLTRSRKVSIVFFALLFYPGVLVHELAHYIAALILFVPVGKMEFVPIMHGDGIKLGSVEIVKTDPIRRILIGVSPIIVGLLIMTSTLYYITIVSSVSSFWQGIIIAYLLFVVGNTMFSSKKDLEGIIEFLLAIGALYTIFYFAGFHILDPKIIFTPLVVSLLTKATFYLVVPIGVNCVVLLAIMLLRRNRT